MGGLGSGRWYYGGAGGAGGKDTAEDHHRIDIRWLKKRGYLLPGSFGTLSWSTTWGSGETRQTGSINYRVETDRMILTYRYRVNGGEWQDVEQVVRFDRTPCNYGGSRKWFLCPSCSKRVAVLYDAGKYFLCRHCHDLCYTSQQESETDRMMRKQRKIRKSLGASNNLSMPIWRNPKGMHWKTFHRLVAQDKKIDVYKWALIGKKIGVLQKNLGRLKNQLGMKR